MRRLLGDVKADAIRGLPSCTCQSGPHTRVVSMCGSAESSHHALLWGASGFPPVEALAYFGLSSHHPVRGTAQFG